MINRLKLLVCQCCCFSQMSERSQFLQSTACIHLSNKAMLFAIRGVPCNCAIVQLWFRVKRFDYSPIATVVAVIAIIYASVFTIQNIAICNEYSPTNHLVLLSNTILKLHSNIVFFFLSFPSCLECSGLPTVLLRCLLEMNSKQRSPFSYTPSSSCIFTFCHFILVCDRRSLNLGPLHGQYLWQVGLNLWPNYGVCF